MQAWYSQIPHFNAEIREESWSNKDYASTTMIQELSEKHRDSIERIDSENFSNTEFKENFEKISKPCLIKGLARKWNKEKFSWNVSEF